MRKIFTILLAVLLLSTVVFAGCGDDTGYMRIKLNGGAYTEEYIAEKNYSGDGSNVSCVINKAYYEGMLRYLPEPENLIAPEGKILAWWYYSEDCEEGTDVNEKSFEARYAESDSASVYAKWIDDDKVDFILNVNDSNGSFNDAFREREGGFTHKTPSITVSRNNLQELFDWLPTAEDMRHIDTYQLQYWVCRDTATPHAPITIESLQTLVDENPNVGSFKLYGYWDR